jgi:hypothetical protein
MSKRSERDAAFREGLRAARITSSRDALLRVAIIAVALSVAWFVPAAWYWKIIVFLAIMFVAGVVVPAIKRGSS